MKLRDVVSQLATLDESSVIFARRPWTSDADAIVTTSDSDGMPPAGSVPDGYERFLERFVALEVLEVFGKRTPSQDEALRLLIHYADHDAYPEWVYE